MKKLFFKTGAVLLFFGIAILALSVYGFYMTLGFRILSANSVFGSYFMYYPLGFAISFLLIAFGLLLTRLFRSKKIKSDDDNEQQTNNQENPPK